LEGRAEEEEEGGGSDRGSIWLSVCVSELQNIYLKKGEGWKTQHNTTQLRHSERMFCPACTVEQTVEQFSRTQGDIRWCIKTMTSRLTGERRGS
jgi:hypothetical protein